MSINGLWGPKIVEYSVEDAVSEVAYSNWTTDTILYKI